MRILHIITRLIVGGAQENTGLSVLGQAAKGHAVLLLTGPTTGPEGSIVGDLRAAGADLVEEPTLLRAIAPLSDWRAVGRLRARIREFRPDVVHTHSSKAGILGRIAAWRERVPFILHTIHGLPFHPYQSWWKNRLYIAAERYAARRCHRIASVADAMTEQAVAAGVAPREKFVTVYSGMRTERFLAPPEGAEAGEAFRAHFGLTPEDRVIGKVARLFELKGHDDLLEAFAAIAPTLPKAKLLLVGDGLWRERLQAKALALGIASRIVWTGLIHPDEVPSALHAMDVVVHCSYREGLARVLPQGFLAGKPVISYDVDGAREVVINGETGWLLPPGDGAALQGALRQALLDPTTAARYAAAGQALCRERFDWRTMVDYLLALYDAGLHGPSKPALRT